MYTLNCKGNLIDLRTPRVMGIINLTPDSFFDGGKLVHAREIIAQAAKMLDEGATFLDVGGYSSRPGATAISEAEELNRVVDAIALLTKEFPKALISIDTFRSKVAKEAVSAGAAMVNDISGGKLDKLMLETVASMQVPYIMMHMRGTPQDMTSHTHYEHVVTDVMRYFSERIAAARAHGINDIVVDPGFGFAKTSKDSFQLLNSLEGFTRLELPILVGVSRKSMIYKTLKTTPEHALNGTSVLHTVALTKGASILRVHDVKEAMECITLTENLRGAIHF